MAWIDNLYF
jgi:hypothetical protein